MANFTQLVEIVNSLFDVIDALVLNITDLITGNLLVLAIVGGFIGVILAILGLIYKYLKGVFGASMPKTRMK